MKSRMKIPRENAADAQIQILLLKTYYIVDYLSFRFFSRQNFTQKDEKFPVDRRGEMG